MVTMIEGPRNTGKTFLLSQTNKQVYKFPFANYIKESYTKQLNNIHFDELNKNKPIHYFSVGSDLAVLELDKQNIINNVYVDRNFLSTLVFGIQSGRISYDTALIEGEYIKTKYDNYRIIYINRELVIEDNRNKDDYDIYKYDETHTIYHSLIYDLGLDDKITYFTNHFDNESIKKFKEIIYK